MKKTVLFIRLKSLLLLFFAILPCIATLQAQDASVSDATTPAWATTQTFNSGLPNQVTIALGGGAALASKKVCAASAATNVPSLSSSNTHYVEISLPTTSTATITKISVEMSSNSTGTTTYTSPVFYCGEPAFDVTKVLGYASATFTGSDKACPSNVITLPAGVKSIRIYKQPKYTTGTPYNTVETGSVLSGWANQTTSVKSVYVWLTVAPSAVLTVTPNSLSGFTYAQGSGPSANQSFTVDGTLLSAGAITVAAPTNFEVSLSPTTGFGSSVTIAETGTLASTTAYARLASGLLQTASPFSGNLTVSGGGATAKTVALAGTVTAAVTPTLSVSSTALTGFSYVFGSGPSTQQTFNVSGLLLTAGSAVIVAVPSSSNYEVSLSSASGYASSVSIANASGGTLAATPIYVRLKSGLALNASYTDNITVSGGGSVLSSSVSLAGAVLAAPLAAPAIGSIATAPTEDGFTASWTAVTNATGYIVNIYQGATIAKTVTITGQTITSTLITGLSSSTAYTYKVIAVGNGTTNSNSVESLSSSSITTLVASVVITSPCAITRYTSDLTDWPALTGSGSNSDVVAVGPGFTADYVPSVFPKGVIGGKTGYMSFGSNGGTLTFKSFNIVKGGSVIIELCNTGTSTGRTLSLKANGSATGVTASVTSSPTMATAWTVSGNTVDLGKPTASNGIYVLTFTLDASISGDVVFSLYQAKADAYYTSITVCSDAGSAPILTTSPQPETTRTFSAPIGGNTTSTALQVKGYHLTNDVNLSIVGTDAGRFTLPVSTISMADALSGKNIGVVYTSSVIVGTHTAVLKIASIGADTVSVNLFGVSTPVATTPVILADTATIPFWTSLIATTTNTIDIAGVNLIGVVALTITGADAGQFALSTSSLSIADATAGKTVTITYTGNIEAGVQTAVLEISTKNGTTLKIPLKATTLDTKPVMYPLTFEVKDEATGLGGVGSVITSPASTKFMDGTNVIVTVTPETGYTVDYWSDRAGGTRLTRTITVNDKDHKGNIIVWLKKGVVIPPVDPTSTFTAYDPTIIAPVIQTGFTASWSSVTGATAYAVKVYDASGILVSTTPVASTASTYAVTGLTAGTFYSYVVEATITSASGTVTQSSNQVGPFETVALPNTLHCGQY